MSERKTDTRLKKARLKCREACTSLVADERLHERRCVEEAKMAVELERPENRVRLEEFIDGKLSSRGPQRRLFRFLMREMRLAAKRCKAVERTLADVLDGERKRRRKRFNEELKRARVE